jgi:vacuolar protein sorting-associated protein 53
MSSIAGDDREGASFTASGVYTASKIIPSTLLSAENPVALLDSIAVSASPPASLPSMTLMSSSLSSPSSSSFDPIDFINRYYPTESDLHQYLPSLQVALENRTNALNDDIALAIQHQSEHASTTRAHISSAYTSVHAVISRIEAVRQKAAESEATVKRLTSEMQAYDHAKQHLQKTITTLKQLHMLVHAVEQLRRTTIVAPNHAAKNATTTAALTHDAASQFSSSTSSTEIPESKLITKRASTGVTASRGNMFPDYGTASGLVDATRFLLAHFDAYVTRVQQMNQLNTTVNVIHNHLQTKLIHYFRIRAHGYAIAQAIEQKTLIAGADTATSVVVDDESMVMPVDIMKDGILYIDALGDDARSQFIRIFCNDQLLSYQRDFEPPQPTKPKPSTVSPVKAPEKRISSFKVKQEPEKSLESDSAGTTQKPPLTFYKLGNVENRFLWFREMMEKVEHKFPGVFPTMHNKPPAIKNTWNFHAILARKFLEITRDHIRTLLQPSPRRDPDAGNATTLLKALQKTILFENEIASFLSQEFGTVFRVAQSNRKTLKKQDAALAATSTSPAVSTDNEEFAVDTLIGVASMAFHNYMDPYIRLEEQSMDEQLVQALEDRTVDTRGEHPVFISSTNLFVYIKGSITRCTALTTGNTFFLLYQAFLDSLRKYAQILQSKLPSPITTSVSSNVVGGINLASVVTVGGNKSDNTSSTIQSTIYRIPPGEEIMVCHVVTTCEYCADTIEALEDLIRDTVDEEYVERISMLEGQEAFHDITAKAIRVLVSGLIQRIDPAFKDLSNQNWANCDVVGEESSYVRRMHDEIRPFVLIARKSLPVSYFRSFCDKFLISFAAAYRDCIIRLKRISEPGTQQLLLDVYSLKTLFLKVPVMEENGTLTSQSFKTSDTTSITPAVYEKTCQKQFSSLETLLKLVGTPLDLVVDNFRAAWVGGTAADLQSVLSLKGLKRNEQAVILEQYGMSPANALKGATAGVTSATIVAERVQALQDQGSTVAAKVNSDLNQMRQKVDHFAKQFRQ